MRRPITESGSVSIGVPSSRMRPDAGSTSRAKASARYSPPAPTGPIAATASPRREAARVDDSSSVAPDSSRIDDAARGDLARRCAAASSASSFCSAGIEHLADRELLDDLRVLHLHVEALLVPVDQVLQRRGQLLVGGDDGDELADVEAAGDREVAADQVEDERRDLGEQVVDEFDQELPLVDVEADEEDLRQPAGDLGALPVRRVVDADAGDALDDLADAAGELRGRSADAARPSTRSRRRSRGISTTCTPTIAPATRPSVTLCSRMKTMAVTAWLIR